MLPTMGMLRARVARARHRRFTLTLRHGYPTVGATIQEVTLITQTLLLPCKPAPSAMRFRPVDCSLAVNGGFLPPHFARRQAHQRN